MRLAISFFVFVVAAAVVEFEASTYPSALLLRSIFQDKALLHHSSLFSSHVFIQKVDCILKHFAVEGTYVAS